MAPVMLTFVGCTSGAPSLAVDGYERTSPSPGCYEQVSPRAHSVRLSADLEQLLSQLLPETPSGLSCWHERLNGNLVLTRGDICGPHHEAEFERLGTSSMRKPMPATLWSLKEFKENAIVLCHERRQ